MTYVQGAIIHFSHVFDPFLELIHWLESIALGDLLAEFSVDEEGVEKTFRASPANAEEIVFEILDRDSADDPSASTLFFCTSKLPKSSSWPSS